MATYRVILEQNPSSILISDAIGPEKWVVENFDFISPGLKYGYAETGSITFEQLESGAHSGGKCKGPTASFSCCREDNKCGEGEGDCDLDKDCLEGLKCGKDNCKISAGFRPDYDCCIKP